MSKFFDKWWKTILTLCVIIFVVSHLWLARYRTVHVERYPDHTEVTIEDRATGDVTVRYVSVKDYKFESTDNLTFDAWAGFGFLMLLGMAFVGGLLWRRPKNIDKT